MRPPKLDRDKRFEAFYLVFETPDKDRLSRRDVSKHFLKQYAIDIDHSNVTRAVTRVQRELITNPDLAKQYAEWKAGRNEAGKIFYKTNPLTGEISSSYVTVQAYIDRRVLDGARKSHLVSTLKQAQKCWLFLEKKDPASWKEEEVDRFLVEGRTLSRKVFTPQCRISYKVAARAVAPNVKSVDGGTTRYKQAMRKMVPVVKSPVFLKEYKEIIASDKLTDFERFVFRLHVVLGCREGTEDPRASILGLQWEDYDAQTRRMQVFESKVVGWWQNIPLDVLDPDFEGEFHRYWLSRNRPSNGTMLGIDYDWLRALYVKIKSSFDFLNGKRFTPHFARKTHVNILWEADIPSEIIAGDARAHEGYVGVGWTDMTTLKEYYLSIAKSKLDEYRVKARAHFSRVDELTVRCRAHGALMHKVSIRDDLPSKMRTEAYLCEDAETHEIEIIKELVN
jgi:hypothetical protein